jgi:hypothetical protein
VIRKSDCWVFSIKHISFANDAQGLSGPFFEAFQLRICDVHFVYARCYDDWANSSSQLPEQVIDNFTLSLMLIKKRGLD